MEDYDEDENTWDNPCEHNETKSVQGIFPGSNIVVCLDCREIFEDDNGTLTAIQDEPLGSGPL